MGKEVRFKPLNLIINGSGFVLGLFFANLIMPVIDAITSFMSGGGEFPLQSVFGPVTNMVGPLSLIIIAVVGIMLIFFIKKILGFVLFLLFGLLIHAVLTAAGFQIPPLFDLIRGVLGG